MTMFQEADPFGKTAKEPGAKLDAGKAPIYQGALAYFPRALEAVAQLSAIGAQKYSWKGWESVPDGFNRYSDALVRHLAAEVTEGRLDLEIAMRGYEVLHTTQVAWNALARLELLLRKPKASISLIHSTGGSKAATG